MNVFEEKAVFKVHTVAIYKKFHDIVLQPVRCRTVLVSIIATLQCGSDHYLCKIIHSIMNEPFGPFIRYVEDITIPDGALLEPGTLAMKSILFRNAGHSDIEDGDCSLVVVWYDTCFTDICIPVPASRSGETFCVDIPVRVPQQSGEFTTMFKFMNNQRELFGPRTWIHFRVEEDFIHFQTMGFNPELD